jgi:hypothetical protein
MFFIVYFYWFIVFKAFHFATQQLSCPSRGLIVSIDNRELSWDYKDQHYPTITSIINRDYAIQQQYDFLYVRNDVRTLVDRVKAKYPTAVEDPMMAVEQVAKDVATGFNIKLKEYRAASWAKLPALWNITAELGHRYTVKICTC